MAGNPISQPSASQQPIAAATASQVKDTERGQLNQLVGKMVDNQGSQAGQLVTALQALAAAITAKASA
jgi:hypothetical protein